MRIALVGCGHGELDSIYASVAQIEAVHQTTVDLLLICGDFQVLRWPRTPIAAAVAACACAATTPARVRRFDASPAPRRPSATSPT